MFLLVIHRTKTGTNVIGVKIVVSITMEVTFRETIFFVNPHFRRRKHLKRRVVLHVIYHILFQDAQYLSDGTTTNGIESIDSKKDK